MPTDPAATVSNMRSGRRRGDDVLRWVAEQYRTRLMEISEEACAQVDELMVRADQGWICDATVVDPNELLTSHEIEQRHGIQEAAVRALARRNDIEPQGKRGKANLYRLGDILSARAKR